MSLTIVVLIALLSLDTSVSAENFSAPCDRPESTWFSVWTAPLRDMVSGFLHAGCFPHTETEASQAIQIAIWPQYANLSAGNDSASVHIEGYAYSSPKCADSLRWQILRNLLGFTGGNISHVCEPIWFPDDFSSYSVTGAVIFVDVGHAQFTLQATLNEFGHFDGFMTLPISLELPSSNDLYMRILDINVVSCKGPSLGNSIAFVTHYIPSHGLTIVSDIDDILRVAEIWNYKQALLRLFALPFEPWLNMPNIFADWRRAVPNAHFHYTSDAPETTHEFYVRGIHDLYIISI